MDILLLILLAVGFINGLFSGAVKQIISLVAFVIGFVVACLYYQQLAVMLDGILSMPKLCRVAAFVLLLVVVPIIIKTVGDWVSSFVDELPGIGFLNRLLGGFVGLVKYALVLGSLIWLFSSMNLIPKETLQKSRLCAPLKALPEYVYNTLLSPYVSDGAKK